MTGLESTARMNERVWTRDELDDVWPLDKHGYAWPLLPSGRQHLPPSQPYPKLDLRQLEIAAA